VSAARDRLVFQGAEALYVEDGRQREEEAFEGSSATALDAFLASPDLLDVLVESGRLDPWEFEVDGGVSDGTTFPLYRWGNP